MPFDKSINSLTVVEKFKSKFISIMNRMRRGISIKLAKVPYITLDDSVSLNYVNAHYNLRKSKDLP